MTPDQQRAYAALGLGPVWLVRLPTASGKSAAKTNAEWPAQATPEDAQQDAPQPTDEAVPMAAEVSWDELAVQVSECRKCGLCSSRRQTVFGTGPQTARLMIVGEAPGQEEDASGEPFVGSAGKLLDSMLTAIGMNRSEHVFIANVLKCRPPGNRNPAPEEVAACFPYLQHQIALLQPELILVMGRFAAQALLNTEASIASLRGRQHTCELPGLAVPVLVTYHPAYLLRNLPDKSKAWTDLLLTRSTLLQLQNNKLMPD